MIPENLNSDTGIPRDDQYEETTGKARNDDDNDEGYDILPSNGPGLAGDDGEQVIDDVDLEEDDDEDDEDDDE